MMNLKNNSLPRQRLAFVVILSLMFLAYSPLLLAEEDVITDIILINGQAELVDVNQDGIILQRHISIPDYFSSDRSHKRSLRESLAKTKLFGLTTDSESSIQTIVYNAPVEYRQSLMKKVKTEVIQSEAPFNMKHNVSRIRTSERSSFLSPYQISFSWIFNRSIARSPRIRQRTLIDDRLMNGALNFKAASRTSKAEIDV